MIPVPVLKQLQFLLVCAVVYLLHCVCCIDLCLASGGDGRVLLRMDPATSESEQDGGATSGEDNSFERPNASSSGHSETDSQYAEQNPQVPYRTHASTSNADSYAGMMIANSCLPFMMQQSYQSAVQGTSSSATTTLPYAQYAAANAFFFNQNSLAKDAEGLATAGSPLNLQMASGQTDRARIGPSHSDFNGATLPQQQQQRGLAAASPSPGIQHARASPHLIAASSYASPAHQPTPSPYMSLTGNSLPGHSQFPGDIGCAKTDGAPKPTEYPPPPKKPLTPYMRFNKFVSLILVYCVVLLFWNKLLLMLLS